MTISADYTAFLASKADRAQPSGFAAEPRCAALFAWQRECVRWALAQGRAALFEDTGLGKTVQQLAWADEVGRHTGGRVLVLAPLAVGAQTVREGTRFGIDGVAQDRDGTGTAPITVANYESLHKFRADDFVGVALDESSILKNLIGARRKQLVAAFASTPYRLCCTATPAPNDYTEIGNHAEFLGVATYMAMLARFFVNDSSDTKVWRLKGHAVAAFWDWVASWSRCVGLPSDLGPYSDDGYVLPPLDVQRHIVAVDQTSDRAPGRLFRAIDGGALALHAERRRTAADRAECVARLVAAEPSEPWVIWCDTDYDADAVRAVVPETTEVRGHDPLELKIARLDAFADGRARIMLTKPRVAGLGLNWQHCARVAFVGPSYSYEALYQAIRRCWRFGQSRPVVVHAVLAETEQAVWATLTAKRDDHDAMKVQMFAASRRAARQAHRATTYAPTCRAPLPDWLVSQEVTPCAT